MATSAVSTIGPTPRSYCSRLVTSLLLASLTDYFRSLLHGVWVDLLALDDRVLELRATRLYKVLTPFAA